MQENTDAVSAVTPCLEKQTSARTVAVGWTEENRMDDLISRQAAIDAARDWYEGLICGSFKGLEKRLRALPSAQPEPKRGRWIYCEDSTADCVDGYRCDQCGFFVPWDYQHKSIDYIKDYNFCPKCGSYNGGEQDG